MNIHRFIARTRAEGPGLRAAVWVQGCSRRCKGCFAVETWSHEPNIIISPGTLAEKIMTESDIEGVTLLGGEPFEQAHEVAQFLRPIRDAELSVIVFTGGDLDKLHESTDPDIQSIIDCSDVIIDGRYDESLRDFSRPMAGSSNQRFHFLTERYRYEDFPPNRTEVRIMPDGSVQFNGMGDFDKLKKKFDLI